MQYSIIFKELATCFHFFLQPGKTGFSFFLYATASLLLDKCGHQGNLAKLENTVSKALEEGSYQDANASMGVDSFASTDHWGTISKPL